MLLASQKRFSKSFQNSFLDYKESSFSCIGGRVSSVFKSSKLVMYFGSNNGETNSIFRFSISHQTYLCRLCKKHCKVSFLCGEYRAVLTFSSTITFLSILSLVSRVACISDLSFLRYKYGVR